MFKLENPMTVEYLKKNIRKKSPRLLLTPEIERNLKKKLNSDPLAQSFFLALQSDAAEILKLPLPERVIRDKKRL